ncbi:MAG TPA: FMN-binding protein, partial [Eubacteriales bacterium]|nr:FMN-binding protein [Eubacteriales bacterium]
RQDIIMGLEVVGMTKKKKIIIISIVAAVLIIAGVVVGLMLKTVSDYKKKLESIQITDIDISSLSDGIYTGEYDVGLIYVKAEVTVVSGEITKIVLLKHENG